MANWAITDYVIEGPHEILEKINEAIRNPDIEAGSSEGWEGNILNTLGIDWDKKLYMRGFITEEPSLGDNTLEFYAEEAWGATDFHEALEKAFPDIRVYYRVEEENDEVFATNDVEGKYFPEKYYVNICINRDYDSEYFKDEDTMCNWLSRKTDGKVNSIEEASDYNTMHEEQGTDEDNYITIHKFDIV